VARLRNRRVSMDRRCQVCSCQDNVISQPLGLQRVHIGFEVVTIAEELVGYDAFNIWDHPIKGYVCVAQRCRTNGVVSWLCPLTSFMNNAGLSGPMSMSMSMSVWVSAELIAAGRCKSDASSRLSLPLSLSVQSPCWALPSHTGALHCMGARLKHSLLC